MGQDVEFECKKCGFKNSRYYRVFYDLDRSVKKIFSTCAKCGDDKLDLTKGSVVSDDFYMDSHWG